MNNENLKRIASTEEARELGRLGGLKSAEVRREKAKLKDELIMLLNSNLDDETTIRQKISIALIKKH